MSDFLGNVTAGSWPDWVAAICTSLAFIIAARSYARDVRNRRESQARLVYAKIIHVEFLDGGTEFEMLPHGAKIGASGGGAAILPPKSPGEHSRQLAILPLIHATAAVYNRSNELIGPLKVQVVNVGRALTYEDFAVPIGTMEPASEYVVDFTMPNHDHPNQPSIGTTVIFRDASGRWWRRHLAEPIELVHNDPENDAPTPVERAAYARNARAMGLTPTADPKVPIIVRWHRFWRKRRRKSAIP